MKNDEASAAPVVVAENSMTEAAKGWEQLLTALIRHARDQSAINERVVAHLLELTERVGWLERRGGTTGVYLGDHLALTRLCGRYKAYVDTRDVSLSVHLLTDGAWEPNITRVFTARLRPGMHVVDVGANIGYYSLLAADRVGPQGFLWAFEPDPRNFQLLCWNLEVNGFAARSHARRAAVLDRSTRLPFAVHPTHFGSHRVLADPHACPSASDLMVETIALDEALPADISVDLVKIDAEGCEPYIWDGMAKIRARNRVLEVILEFDPRQIRQQGRDPATFLAAIEADGFALHRITEDGRLAPCSPPELLEGGWQMLYLARSR